MTYYMLGFSFLRLILVIAPVFQFILLLIWNGIVLNVRKRFSADLKFMVIGERSELGSVIEKVSHTLKRAKLHIHCVIPTDEIGKAFKRLKDVDEVFISDNVSDQDKMKAITECLARKKVVYIVPRMFEISLSSARMVQFEDMPAFMADRLGLMEEQRFFKRSFFVEQYSRDMPEYTHRYLVKAGMTGYAQIYGKYDTSVVDKLKYDLLYIRNYSLMLDIKLILHTLKVLMGKKAVCQGHSAENSRSVKAKFSGDSSHLFSIFCGDTSRLFDFLNGDSSHFLNRTSLVLFKR